MKKTLASRRNRHFRSYLAGLIALVAVPSLAEAQAWVEDKGALTGSASYIGAVSDDLVDPNGDTYDGDDLSITNHTLTLGLEYVPIDKLGLSLDLPFLAVKYGGEQDGMFPPHGEYDDGSYHFTPTDARLGVRYQLLSGLKAVAPHIAISVPMADYPTTGFAGGGRHIIKGYLGLSGGIVLDPWVPDLYLHATAEYSIGTKPKVDDPMFDENAIDEYSQSAMDFNVSIGYFVNDKLTVTAVVGAHYQSDGITLNQIPFGAGAEQEVLFKWHDPVLKESYVHPGLDLSYALTEALGVSGHFRMFASGASTRNIIGGGIGLTYTILEPKLADYGGDWEEDEEAWDDAEQGDDSGVDIEASGSIGVDVDASADVGGSDDSAEDSSAEDSSSEDDSE